MATPMWPFYGSVTTSTSGNQAMVAYLVRTDKAYKTLPLDTKRNLAGLGIELAQCRDENLGVTMGQLGKQIGLDPGFICLLENGKILPEDITVAIWKRIRKVKGFSYSSVL